MALFSPVPDPPTPNGGYNPTRESDSLASLQSTIDVLQAMIEAFDKFTLTQFTDADGNIWQALLINNGKTTLAAAPSVVAFRIATRENPDIPGAFQFAVMMGELRSDDTPDDTIDIDGISEIYDDTDDSVVWVDWNGSDDKIWLDGTVESGDGGFGTVTACEVASESQGGTFDTSADAYSSGDAWLTGDPSDDNPSVYIQSGFKRLLARITSAEDGSIKIVEQATTTNLVMMNEMINGISPSIVPRPY